MTFGDIFIVDDKFTPYYSEINIDFTQIAGGELLEKAFKEAYEQSCWFASKEEANEWFEEWLEELV